MRTLESELPELQELDALRRRVQQLRKEGVKCILEGKYDEAIRRHDDAKKRGERPPVEPIVVAGGLAEASRVLWSVRRADLDAIDLKSNEGAAKAAIAACEKRLCALGYDPSINKHSEAPKSPVLGAALAVRAMALRIDQHQETLFSYLYRIVYEVHLVNPPYASGGARANEHSEPTAAITNACVRSALALMGILRSLAEHADDKNEKDAAKALESVRPFAREWCALYEDRDTKHRELAWKKEFRVYGAEGETLSWADVGGVAKRLERIVRVRTNAGKALTRVGALARARFFGEPGDPPKNPSSADDLRRIYEGLMGRPPTNPKDAHGAPMLALQECLADLDVGARNHLIGLYALLFSGMPDDPKTDAGRRALEAHRHAVAFLQELEGLEDPKSLLRRIHDGVLERTVGFLQVVIDRELAMTARHPRGECDAAELCFALCGYGAILHSRGTHQDAWRDPRITQGVEVLLKLLSEDGYLPSHRAFAIRDKGYRLYAVPSEVVGALAHVLRWAPGPVSPDVPRRMLRVLELTRAKEGTAPRGWMPDEVEAEGKAHWWSTAVAVDALHAIERMLDHEINRRVYEHFLTKHPDVIDDQMDTLFYPDYGLVAAREKKVGPDRARQTSIAHTLLRMYAHLKGVEYAEKEDALYSVVFYGPPGTGKTTLLEAVAKSAAVRLVQVTPSDILTSGTDHAEARARAVFEALSMLTETVVILDEFDSLLFNRDEAQDEQPSNVFQFITPGMLPKLKQVHSRAKRQRLVFALATNYLSSLDRAAVRDGRFDRKIGVFPPDPLSRLGRLAHQYASWEKRPSSHDVLPTEQIARIVASTARVPMPTAARRSWFTAPKDDKTRPRSPFEAITECKSGVWDPAFEPEDELPPRIGWWTKVEAGWVLGMGTVKRYADEVAAVRWLHLANEKFRAETLRMPITATTTTAEEAKAEAATVAKRVEDTMASMPEYREID